MSDDNDLENQMWRLVDEESDAVERLIDGIKQFDDLRRHYDIPIALKHYANLEPLKPNFVDEYNRSQTYAPPAPHPDVLTYGDLEPPTVDEPQRFTFKVHDREYHFEMDANALRVSVVFGWSDGTQCYCVRNPIPVEHYYLVKQYPIADPFYRTKQIFPVLTSGPNEEPVNLNDVHLILSQNYGLGNHLIYIIAAADEEVNANIPVLSMPYFGNRTLSTNGYLCYFECFGATTRYHAPITRIYELFNPMFSFAGIYGGGPMPTVLNRCTYDQPIERKMYAYVGNFRFDINRYPLAERIGYLCSKNALIYVVEIGNNLKFSLENINSKHGTRSLLREGTFAIVDGRHRRVTDYDSEFCKVNRIFEYNSDNFYNVAHYPKIVIQYEGVNLLRVTRSTAHPTQRLLRHAFYCSSNIYDLPIVLDWFTVQTDFDLSPNKAGHPLRPIMRYNEINDCVRTQITTRNLGQTYTMLFSLSQNFLDSPQYDEWWNIFMEMIGGEYCLLAHLHVRYGLAGNGRFNVEYTEYGVSRFATRIGENILLYPELPPKIHMLAKSIGSGNHRRVNEFVYDVLFSAQSDDFENQTDMWFERDRCLRQN